MNDADLFVTILLQAQHFFLFNTLTPFVFCYAFTRENSDINDSPFYTRRNSE